MQTTESFHGSQGTAIGQEHSLTTNLPLDVSSEMFLISVPTLSHPCSLSLQLTSV